MTHTSCLISECLRKIIALTMRISVLQPGQQTVVTTLNTDWIFYAFCQIWKENLRASYSFLIYFCIMKQYQNMRCRSNLEQINKLLWRKWTFSLAILSSQFPPSNQTLSSHFALRSITGWWIGLANKFKYSYIQLSCMYLI